MTYNCRHHFSTWVLILAVFEWLFNGSLAQNDTESMMPDSDIMKPSIKAASLAVIILMVSVATIVAFTVVFILCTVAVMTRKRNLQHKKSDYLQAAVHFTSRHRKTSPAIIIINYEDTLPSQCIREHEILPLRIPAPQKEQNVGINGATATSQAGQITAVVGHHGQRQHANPNYTSLTAPDPPHEGVYTGLLKTTTTNDAANSQQKNDILGEPEVDRDYTPLKVPDPPHEGVYTGLLKSTTTNTAANSQQKNDILEEPAEVDRDYTPLKVPDPPHEGVYTGLKSTTTNTAANSQQKNDILGEPAEVDRDYTPLKVPDPPHEGVYTGLKSTTTSTAAKPTSSMMQNVSDHAYTTMKVPDPPQQGLYSGLSCEALYTSLDEKSADIEGNYLTLGGTAADEAALKCDEVRRESEQIVYQMGNLAPEKASLSSDECKARTCEENYSTLNPATIDDQTLKEYSKLHLSSRSSLENQSTYTALNACGLDLEASYELWQPRKLVH